MVIRADRVDHPPGRQFARRRPAGVAGVETVGKAGDAVAQDRRAAAAMDGAVHPAAAHGFVRRVDDSVDVLRRDVTENGGDAWHTVILHVRGRMPPGGEWHPPQ